MAVFYCRKTSTGYNFKLAASNGATIGTSEEYSSEQNCLNGIQSLKACALDADTEDQTAASYKKRKNPKFEIYQDNAKEYRFRLLAKSGETLLVSPGYSSKTSCLDGIENVQSGAMNATIIKEEALA